METINGYTQRWESLLDTSRVFLFGITIVLGGQVFTWNHALTSCFWPYLSAVLIVGLAYTCFIFSLAEIASGSYGFVRVAIGPMWGYYVGWCEAIQNIFYISVTILTFGQVLCEIFHLSSDFEPLFWLLFFITAFPLNFTSRSWFWNLITIFGFITLAIILLYILISIPSFDFHSNAISILPPVTNPATFVSRILSSFAYVSWMFIGSEYMTVVCHDVTKPRQQIPHGMCGGILSLVMTGVVVFLMVSSTSPGIYRNAEALLPLNSGFAKAFNVSYLQASWFSVPAIYSTGLGFFIVCGRQLSAMARSGLVPFLSSCRGRFKNNQPVGNLMTDSNNADESNSPLVGLSISSISALIIMSVMHFGFSDNNYTILQDICLLSSYVHYLLVLTSYLAMEKKYYLLERAFYSPFGRYGALIGLLLFAVGVVSIVGFRIRVNYAVEAFLGMSVVLLMIYLFSVRQNQSFSLDEQRNLFAAYLINANSRSRRRSTVGYTKSRKLQNSHSISSRAAKYSSASTELLPHQMTSPTSVVELSSTETPRSRSIQQKSGAYSQDPSVVGVAPVELSPPLQLKVGSTDDDAKEIEDIERGKQRDKTDVKRHFSQFFQKIEVDEDENDCSCSDDEDEDEANNAFEQKSILRTFSTDAAKQALKYLLPNSMVRSPFMNKVLASFDESDEIVSPPPRHPSSKDFVRKQSAQKVPAFRPFSMDDYDQHQAAGNISTGNSLPSTGRRRSNNYLFSDVNNRPIGSPSPAPYEGLTSGPSTGRRRSNAPPLLLPGETSLEGQSEVNLKSASEDFLTGNDLSAASNGSLFQGQVKLKRKRKKATGEDAFANQFLETVMQSNQFPVIDRENDEIIRVLSHDYQQQQQHVSRPASHHPHQPSSSSSAPHRPSIPPMNSLAAPSIFARSQEYMRLASKSRSRDDYCEENGDEDRRERCIRISSDEQEDTRSLFGRSIGQLDKIESFPDFKEREEDESRRSRDNDCAIDGSDGKTEKLFQYLETPMEPLDGPSAVSNSFPLRPHPPSGDEADNPISDDDSLQLSQPDHHNRPTHSERSSHEDEEADLFQTIQPQKKEVPEDLFLPLSEQGFQQEP